MNLSSCLLAVSVAFAVFAVEATPRPPTSELVEVEVQDVLPLEQANTHAIILVSNEGILLPVFVDESAAVAIAFRLANRTSPRAFGEDLVDTIFRRLGGKVLQVELDDFRNLSRQSRIVVRMGSKTYALEARSSDSIAAALTSGARIFATRRMLLEVGISEAEINRLREQMAPDKLTVPEEETVPPPPKKGIQL